MAQSRQASAAQERLGNRRTDGRGYELYEGSEYMGTYYQETVAIKRALDLSRSRHSKVTVWKTMNQKRTAKVAIADDGVL